MFFPTPPMSPSQPSASVQIPTGTRKERLGFGLGQIVQRKYEVLEVLGEGTGGQVFDARRLEDDRECAIKALRKVFLE
jgi:serine/threonine protein kinase